MELKFSGSVQDYLLDRDGVIRSWNAGAERIEGYRAAEAIGQNFSLFFTPEDKAADVPSQILALAGRAGRAERDGWRLRKDGGRFWRCRWHSRCATPAAASSASPRSPAT